MKVENLPRAVEMSRYEIQATELRLDTDDLDRDNYRAIQNSIRLLQEALDDISARLEALE